MAKDIEGFCKSKVLGKDSVRINLAIPHHYYVVCCYGFATSATLQGAIKLFGETFRHDLKGKKLTVMTYYVPLPANAEYQINFYMPQVEGTIKISDDEIQF